MDMPDAAWNYALLRTADSGTSKGRCRFTNKSYSRGLTHKYTLKATFTYDTRTKKIESVTKKNFHIPSAKG